MDDDDAARDAVSTGDADLALLDGASVIVVDEPLDEDEDASSDLVAVVNVLRSDIALTEGLAEAGLSPEEITTALSHEPPAVESLSAGDDATTTTAAVSEQPSSSTSPCSCCSRPTAAGWSAA